MDIVKQQHMDIITLGNHELYGANTTDREYLKNLKNFQRSYISSNVDVIDPETGDRTSIGPRFRKFTTKNQGIRVLAFGFLFDFNMNSNHSIIQPVEQTVKEKWFQDAIHDHDLDIIIVAGHIAPRDQTEFVTIFKAIRAVQPHLPIQFLGGHSHIRDYVKYDDRAFAIQSGRYMETIGFASISGVTASRNATATKLPQYDRLYIDNNIGAFHYHTGLDENSFPTDHGRNVSAAIVSARKILDLDRPFGCAPQDFWLDRAPYGRNDSLLTLLAKDILPDTARNRTEEQRPQMMINNSGSMRFNVFKGSFSVDTSLLISPFTSRFRRLPAVPYASAKQMLRLLNNEDKIQLSALTALQRELDPTVRLEPLGVVVPNVKSRTIAQSGPLLNTLSPAQEFIGPVDEHSRDADSLSYGYTTSDDLGTSGDDTLHKRIVFYSPPNCIASEVYVDEGHPPDHVDVIYNEFVQPWIFLALRFLGLKYAVEDTEVTFDSRLLADIITDWVSEHWKCD